MTFLYCRNTENSNRNPNINPLRLLFVLALALFLILASFPASAKAAQADSTVPKAAVACLRPAGAQVGSFFSEQLISFDDSGYTRNSSFSASFTPDESEDASLGFENAQALPEGLTYDEETGFLSGTPQAAGTLSIQFTVSWDGSENVPAFVRDQVPVVLTIWPESTVPIQPEDTTFLDASSFDNTIEPAESGQWYSFKAPCLNIAVVDESEEDAPSVLKPEIFDRNGFSVSSLGQDKTDASRTGYYLSAGKEYFVFACSPFSIQPEILNSSELGAGSNSSIEWDLAEADKNVERTFDDEENARWDIYTIRCSSDYQLGLLDYGYMYACRSISFVGPYNVYFEGVSVDFSGASDAYFSESDTPNKIGGNAFVHSSETMSTYTTFHYLTSDSPVRGTGYCVVKMYVPAGKSIKLVDGVIRDSNSVHEPKTVDDASHLTNIRNLDNGVRLNWEKSSHCTGYRLQRRVHTSGAKKNAWSTLKTLSSGTLTYLDTTAADGTTYDYRVYCIPKNDYIIEDNGKWIGTFIRLATPKLSAVSNKATRKAQVKWQRNAKCTGYKLLYTTSTIAKGKVILIKSNKTTSYTISNLLKKNTYKIYICTYKPKAEGSGNNVSAWSKVKTVKINK